MRSIIGLAHALRLQVVAEGVEIEEQMAFLDKLGCDEVQGFLMSQPVEPKASAGIIAEDNSREGRAKIHLMPSS